MASIWMIKQENAGKWVLSEAGASEIGSTVDVEAAMKLAAETATRRNLVITSINTIAGYAHVLALRNVGT
jgi:hypothetical protein